MGISLTFKPGDMSKRLQKLAEVLPTRADKAMLDLSVEAVGELKGLTSTWKHPPAISIIPVTHGYEIKIEGDVFFWLDEGVKKHKIEGNPVLAFPTAGKGSYRPATRPRMFISSYAFIEGQVKIVRTTHVDHPGIKPRRYTDELTKRYGKKGTQRVRDALNEAAQMLGL